VIYNERLLLLLSHYSSLLIFFKKQGANISSFKPEHFLSYDDFLLYSAIYVSCSPLTYPPVDYNAVLHSFQSNRELKVEITCCVGKLILMWYCCCDYFNIWTIFRDWVFLSVLFVFFLRFGLCSIFLCIQGIFWDRFFQCLDFSCSSDIQTFYILKNKTRKLS
jgi:hypothetical protein